MCFWDNTHPDINLLISTRPPTSRVLKHIADLAIHVFRGGNIYHDFNTKYNKYKSQCDTCPFLETLYSWYLNNNEFTWEEQREIINYQLGIHLTTFHKQLNFP